MNLFKTKITIFLFALIISVNTPFKGYSEQIPISKWEVGFSKTNDQSPSEWYPSIVPGAVQIDYAKAKKWPAFYYGENWKEYLWMEDVYWTYKTSFKNPGLKPGDQLCFVSKGIDYEFDIYLNGEKLFYQEGMFTAVNLNLSEKLKADNELLVKIYPAPKIPGKPVDRNQAAQSCKPAVSYGWDWHPRLIPLGIWDETYLEIRQAAFITDLYTNYTLNADFSEAAISVQAEGQNLSGISYEWTLTAPDGSKVCNEKGTIEVGKPMMSKLKNPQLWWPHDHGAQPLYVSELVLKDQRGNTVDAEKQKVGFRRVQLVMNEGLWNEVIPFPKTRNKPPITMEINGRRIFCKGTNWVNPEIFPGIITRERYDELLELAKNAHFNLLRIWGGGIVNKESFYELCNEKGILVWTEFPLACNNYEGTPDYLSVLEQESASIIKRIRKHPSNAMWCGGNELFNNWSLMTDQSLALRLLNSQCYLLDPHTPFIPTSPVFGMGHGSYVFRDFDNVTEVYQWMPKSKSTTYTEFGMPGPSPVDMLKSIIPENELFPPMPGTSWESHHAFKAWVGDTWLMKDLLYEYFGEPKNLEELVANGQWIQCEGYKCIYEEARRQKPWCSMALNWCYNEPWPTAANNSILNYPSKPKPAYYAVQQSCRPVLASARIEKFRWKAGEKFNTKLYLLNDQYQPLNGGKIKATIKSGEKTIDLGTWDYEKPELNQNVEGPILSVTIPELKPGKMTLLIEVEGHSEWNSEYDLLFIK